MAEASVLRNRSLRREGPRLALKLRNQAFRGSMVMNVGSSCLRVMLQSAKSNRHRF